jgi:hypothetical protein
MTVAELRALLADMPDDAPVVVGIDPEQEVCLYPFDAFTAGNEEAPPAVCVILAEPDLDQEEWQWPAYRALGQQWKKCIGDPAELN